MCVAIVDLQCETVALRDVDVRLERFDLGVAPVFSGAKEVEAGLADGAHARLRGEARDL